MIVVRYQSFAANAVLTHRFESVARPPLRCDGSRAGIKRCSPLRFFSALSLFGALAQACKQSSRRFADSFSRLLGFVGFHTNQPKRRQKAWRTQIKGISSI